VFFPAEQGTEIFLQALKLPHPWLVIVALKHDQEIDVALGTKVVSQ
jgi:hypothetical protein